MVVIPLALIGIVRWWQGWRRFLIACALAPVLVFVLPVLWPV